MNIPEPAAKRTTLILVAGTLWSIIGLFLIGRGIKVQLPLISISYIFISIAIIIGILKSKFIFAKIINKNVDRIKNLSPHKEKICVFAFQAYQSYLLVIVMMSVGILLRHLPIDHVYYGSILIAIGTALFLSSLRYFQMVKNL